VRGTIFGDRYSATGTVMRGGGGEVYVCDDPNLRRKVAIKFLIPGIEKRRLLDEIAALQKIQSKNVIQVLDIVNDSKFGTGIVTEYLPGKDLTDESVWPDNRVSFLHLAYQLSNGVADIHAANRIHRDLKPNNLKFGDENILKIFDFNLSREHQDGHTIGFRGSHGFAAPEQYEPDPVNFTAKVDVYSMAATLAFIALKGTLPPSFCLQPPDAMAWMPGFLTIPIVDNELAELLNKALVRNPPDRPAAAEIRHLSSRLLLRNAHRATITMREDKQAYEINEKNPTVQLSHPLTGGGSIEITYDGLAFSVTNVNGNVLVNHRQCLRGQQLPNCCVIDLDSPTGRSADRRFVTFDLSNPEVVL